MKNNQNTQCLLITGGCGFMGCNLVRLLLREANVERLVVVDKLTYARERSA